eukprot:m.193209 g.193209  ORF g.193209 m.193209 type:complete len:405 (-) comp15664_c0_seq5:1740-2954(-)
MEPEVDEKRDSLIRSNSIIFIMIIALVFGAVFVTHSTSAGKSRIKNVRGSTHRFVPQHLEKNNNEGTEKIKEDRASVTTVKPEVAKKVTADQSCQQACKAGNEDFQPKANGVLPKHLMLFVESYAFHGTTAVQQALMSNPDVSTLCKGKSWQCEGWKIDDVVKSPKNGPISSRGEKKKLLKKNKIDKASSASITRAFSKWSKYWNLSEPVLLEKTPSQVYIIEEMYNVIKKREFPKIYGDLIPVYIFVWRPFCLYRLSSHTRALAKDKGDAFAVNKELSILKLLLESAMKMRENQAPVLIVNYAELIWKPEVAEKRLHKFFECLPKGFNMSFVPHMGRDAFKSNKWKPKGSVQGFGEKKHPDNFGFSLADMVCEKNSSAGFTKELRDELHRVETLLEIHSRTCS